MILVPVIGVFLVLLLAVDVFLTVFHPQGRGGPLNRYVSRLLWGAFRTVGRRGDGSPRHAVLAFGGPTIVVITLATWVILLVAAFTLIYLPWIETFLVSPGQLRGSWAEAWYYSGYTAATLGFGDVVADSVALRLITVLQAFGGFALLSVSITYFLSVYRELITMQSLAAEIAGLFRRGEAEVFEFTTDEGYETIARWSERLSSGLSRVLLAHFQYPVLHYFHPPTRSRALPVQLGALLKLRRLVSADQQAPVPATLARHPSYLALQDGLEEYLKEVGRLFIPGGDGDDLERTHAQLLEYMVYS